MTSIRGGGSPLRLGLLVAALAASGPGALLHAQRPGAGGCCRELHLLYEASIFQVDAMRLSVRVDEITGAAVESLVRDARRSATLEEGVARRYLAAHEAIVDMEFLVGVSGETFLSHTLKALRELVDDGVLTLVGVDTVSRETTDRYQFLMAAAVRPGDRLRYHVVADTVTTTYRRGDVVLHEDRKVDSRFRDVILGTYFAPSSNFRKGLVRDAFRRT